MRRLYLISGIVVAFRISLAYVLSHDVMIVFQHRLGSTQYIYSLYHTLRIYFHTRIQFNCQQQQVLRKQYGLKVNSTATIVYCSQRCFSLFSYKNKFWHLCFASIKCDKRIETIFGKVNNDMQWLHLNNAKVWPYDVINRGL